MIPTHGERRLGVKDIAGNALRAAAFLAMITFYVAIIGGLYYVFYGSLGR